MAIWKQDIALATLNDWITNDMTGRIGMVYTEVGDDYLRAQVPVDERVLQPFGLWHGGASCVVAEAMGSMASNLCVDRAVAYCVGIEINASHLSSATSGSVHAKTQALRVGRRVQVWDIRLWKDDGKPLCVARLTTAMRERG